MGKVRYDAELYGFMHHFCLSEQTATFCLTLPDPKGKVALEGVSLIFRKWVPVVYDEIGPREVAPSFAVGLLAACNSS